MDKKKREELSEKILVTLYSLALDQRGKKLVSYKIVGGDEE